MITKQSVVLVVDDLEPMRKVTARQLESLGVDKVLVAHNGLDALSILEQQKVDAILSDWHMPEMNGLELLRAVRADGRFCGTPFVLITAVAERERVAEAIASGVSDLLIKPYNTAALAARIQKAMSRTPRSAPAGPAAGTSASPAAAPAVSAPSPATKKNDRPTILVVDDTPDNLELLSHLFKEDYRVRAVLEGQKALDICCSDNPPDLVLLDVMMPNMDGFTVLERMRQHPNGEHIPVIFVTAMTGDEARLKGLELGAVDFVAKPIDPQVVKTRVRNFLRYVELHKQLQADFDEMQETARLREDVEQITRHDMTGPLAGIIGMVQSLAEDKAMNPEQAEQLRMIEESALHVLNMVNRSSELYKIETGRFQLTPQIVKIGDILRRIAGMALNTFSSKQLDISLRGLPNEPGAPLALGDPMLCYSIFHNLLKNACEAAPASSLITIHVAEADHLTVGITNKGAVPAAIRDTFFDKFATSGKADGNGLGTYSAKMLTEAQGGSITMETSDADNQTTVSVGLIRGRKT